MYHFRQEEPFEDKGLSKWAEQLWEADVNRLVPDVDYDIDPQGRTRFSYDGPDMAKDPFFAEVKASALAKPTFAGMFDYEWDMKKIFLFSISRDLKK